MFTTPAAWSAAVIVSAASTFTKKNTSRAVLPANAPLRNWASMKAVIVARNVTPEIGVVQFEDRELNAVEDALAQEHRRAAHGDVPPLARRHERARPQTTVPAPGIGRTTLTPMGLSSSCSPSITFLCMRTKPPMVASTPAGCLPDSTPPVRASKQPGDSPRRRDANRGAQRRPDGIRDLQVRPVEPGEGALRQTRRARDVVTNPRNALCLSE